MAPDTGRVVTVEGPIEPAELGTTLTHEHVFVDLSDWYNEPASAREKRLADQPVGLENLAYLRRNPASNKDNVLLGSYEEAHEEVSRFRAAGGDTIVDVTPKGAGQDPRRVRAIGRETGVQFVHGTAYYVRSGHPDRLSDASTDEIADEFVADVRDGIDDTGVRAGVVGEIGLSATPDGESIHAQELRVLRAGARAARRTGAPLSIHPPGRTEAAQRDRSYPTSRWAQDALDVVLEEGLSPERVVMCHMDRTFYETSESVRELAERGPYLEFDLWGQEYYYDRWHDGLPSDKWRVDTVCDLVDAGHAAQLLFSHDVCLKIGRHKYGGPGYAHILTNAVPLLEHHGVTDQTLEEILVANPRRLLTFAEPDPP